MAQFTCFKRAFITDANAWHWPQFVAGDKNNFL